ncbi:MAG TPA: hypothetical protein VLH84_00275 [Patescibacteria group bacterium]|nr:hypothetical protein [Patescibacteria group bacterium]
MSERKPPAVYFLQSRFRRPAGSPESTPADLLAAELAGSLALTLTGLLVCSRGDRPIVPARRELDPRANATELKRAQGVTIYALADVLPRTLITHKRDSLRAASWRRRDVHGSSPFVRALQLQIPSPRVRDAVTGPPMDAMAHAFHDQLGTLRDQEITTARIAEAIATVGNGVINAAASALGEPLDVEFVHSLNAYRSA